jgi:hypothetical protein
MSPEQADGGDVDARSDQFSFCVALYEGLAGRRPFSGANVQELGRAMHAGAVEPPARGWSIPRWLEQIVRRGLSPKRDDRFASMQELLDALAAGERENDRRRAVLAFIGAAAAAALAVIVAWQWWPHDPPRVVAPAALPASAVAPSVPAPAMNGAALAPPPALDVAKPAPVVAAPAPAPAPATPATSRPSPPPKKGLVLDKKSPYAP